MENTGTTSTVRLFAEDGGRLNYPTACAMATASVRTAMLILANGRKELSVKT